MAKFMKVLIFTAMTFAVSSSVAVAQEKPESPAFTLTLSAKTAKVDLGKDIWITIVMTNISEQVIDCSFWAEHNGVNHAYKYDVRDEQGNMTEKRVLSRSHPEIAPSGASYSCKLEAGKSNKWELAINDVHQFDHPGDYTIQVSRLAGVKPADGYIKSNTITVTLLPKPEADEPK